MIPQGVEQRCPWHEIERVTDAVDDKMDRNAFGNLMRDIAHVLLPATATVPDVSRVDAGARLRRPIAPNGPPTGCGQRFASPNTTFGTARSTTSRSAKLDCTLATRGRRDSSMRWMRSKSW